MKRRKRIDLAQRKPVRRSAMHASQRWFVVAVFLFMAASVCRPQSGKGSGGGGGASQTGSPQSSQNSNSGGGGQGGNQGGSSGGGFSIEAEILAYKALQSDSEAVACDIARFLHQPGTDIFKPNGTSIKGSGKKAQITPFDKTCAKTGPGSSSPTSVPKGVIILSSAGTTLANFQTWRMDMAAMTQLEAKATDYKCPSKEAEQTLSFAGLDIAQQAVTLIQSTLGLFASSESVTGVPGTIQDQAFVDSVGRQLRSLGISVLMPDAYGPFTLSGIDPKTSPFFNNFALLVRCRVCLQARLKEPALQVNKQELDDENSELKADQEKLQADQKAVDGGKLSDKDLNAKMVEIADLKKKIDGLKQKTKMSSDTQNKANDIAGLMASIDSFINGLTGNSPPSGANQGSTQGAQAQPNQGGNQGANSVPPIAAVLAADGLARELGIKADGTGGGDSIWQHVLWLKALESGGSLITHSNIFGSKVFFSGGAAATYALFSLNGHLSCSGNVYDYGGYLRAKDFSAAFRNPDIDPTKQLVSLRGGCSTPDEVASTPAK
jgi:hypothetical protein